MTSPINLKDAGDTAIKLLCCRICKQILIEPVFTCDDWHAVCGSCFLDLDRRTCYCSKRLVLNNCAKCLLNKIYPTLKCRNYIYGCTDVHSPALMLQHLQICRCRKMECPLQGPYCTKWICTPQEVLGHLKDCHDIKEVPFSSDEKAEHVVSRNLRLSFPCSRSGFCEPPVWFSTPRNFLISCEIMNGILIWWICTDDAVDVCSQYKYDTFIHVNATGKDEQPMVPGRNLPIYGIRYAELRNLLNVNGSFSAFSVNTLLMKKYSHQKYSKDDFVDVTISFKLIPSTQL